MPIEAFPDVNLADESGLLGVGGDLDPKSLLLAYSQGIFPWPHSDFAPLAWYSPDPRGVLCYEDLHIPRSLDKLLRQDKFNVTFNQDFETVIRECAKAFRKDQNGTWITENMLDAYTTLFYQGHAHSVEVYQGDELVGGLYGVKVKNFYNGESMFHKVSNASKIALVSLMRKLHEENIDWIDIQMVTEVTRSLGGKEISRDDFLKNLSSQLT